MITTLLSPKIKRFPPIEFPAASAIIPLTVASGGVADTMPRRDIGDNLTQLLAWKKRHIS